MWTLRLFIAVCLIFAVRGLGVAWTAVVQRDLYIEAQAAGPWTLRVGLNALWGVLFLALSWGLWRRRAWAYHTLIPALAVYALFGWAWLEAFAQADYDRERGASLAVTSLLGVGLAYCLRLRLRRMFLEKKNDH